MLQVTPVPLLTQCHLQDLLGSRPCRLVSGQATPPRRPALATVAIQPPSNMTGLISPNSNMVALSSSRHMTTARTSGRSAAMSGSRRLSPRSGSVGSLMSEAAVGG